MGLDHALRQLSTPPQQAVKQHIHAKARLCGVVDTIQHLQFLLAVHRWHVRLKVIWQLDAPLFQIAESIGHTLMPAVALIFHKVFLASGIEDILGFFRIKWSQKSVIIAHPDQQLRRFRHF